MGCRGQNPLPGTERRDFKRWHLLLFRKTHGTPFVVDEVSANLVKQMIFWGWGGEKLLCVPVDVDFASRHFKTATTVKTTASRTLKSYFCGSRLRLLTFFHKVRWGFAFSIVVAGGGLYTYYNLQGYKHQFNASFQINTFSVPGLL